MTILIILAIITTILIGRNLFWWYAKRKWWHLDQLEDYSLEPYEESEDAVASYKRRNQ